jgi:hypothetical protein
MSEDDLFFKVGDMIIYNKKKHKIIKHVNKVQYIFDDYIAMYDIQDSDTKQIYQVNEEEILPYSEINVINYNNSMRKSIDLQKIADKFNLFIKDNIYKLSFNLEDNTFEFNPINTYLTIDEKHYFVVILYNIKRINNTSKLITEANIPYYVSDGHTNKLRANLLFPFLCFNEEISQFSCPYTENGILSKGGLFKNTSIKNIKLEEYHNIIEEKSFEIIKEIKPESSIRDITEESKRIGILSVLPRIENLLDFFICINNKNIINYNKSRLSYYYPFWTKKLKKQNNLSLNMNKKGLKAELHSHTDFMNQDDYYRAFLLEFLQESILKLSKLPFFKSELVNISITTDNIITKPYFNTFINNPPICHRRKTNNYAIININKYKNISLSFGHEVKIFLEKIIDKLNEINEINKYQTPDKQIKKEYSIDVEIFINEFIEIIIDKPTISTIDKQLLGFNAKCHYEKYKKYKRKYLMLKENSFRL